MKNILFATICFIIGFSGVFGFSYFLNQKKINAVVNVISSSPTPEPTFSLIPPSTAVSGILTVTSGHVKKFSRNETEYKEASTGAQILLGESVATGDNSSAVATVSGIVNVGLGPTSELVFANLFPTNFVLQQKSGKIDYTAMQPIAVRALHTLVSMGPSETTINIIDTDLSITVKSGSLKFALVDNDNNTNVYNLSTGDRANIDDSARDVFLVKPR